jgi:hypothetical protein
VRGSFEMVAVDANGRPMPFAQFHGHAEIQEEAVL